MKTIFNDKRFFRDAQQAKVSGVCAGIAKHLNIDPWLVRVLAGGMFLFFPFAIGLAYVLAILLVRYQ